APRDRLLAPPRRRHLRQVRLGHLDVVAEDVVVLDAQRRRARLRPELRLERGHPLGPVLLYGVQLVEPRVVPRAHDLPLARVWCAARGARLRPAAARSPPRAGGGGAPPPAPLWLAPPGPPPRGGRPPPPRPPPAPRPPPRLARAASCRGWCGPPRPRAARRRA